MTTHEPFDDWLEQELRAQLDDAAPSTPPAARYALAPQRHLRFVAALSVRTATALAVLALCAGAGAVLLVGSNHQQTLGSAASAVAANETSDSSAGANQSAGATNHGAAVTSAVASCKAARPSPHASPRPSPGSRGIGDCVSQVASGGRAGGNASPGHGAGDNGAGRSDTHPTPSHP